MLPENAAVTVTDVLNYHQKKGHFNVSKRGFSAISLRLNTDGKYIWGNKTLAFKPTSICIIPAGVAYERISLEDDILWMTFRFIKSPTPKNTAGFLLKPCRYGLKTPRVCSTGKTRCFMKF